MYEVKYHPKIKKDLKKIDPKLREKIRIEHIPKILSDPRTGEKLSGDLNGTCSYHFKMVGQQFRIAYILIFSRSFGSILFQILFDLWDDI